MSAASAQDFGRRKVRFVDLVLDSCPLTYGQQPCSPYPAETVLSLDSTSGWSAFGADITGVATTTTCKEGVAGITFNKTGTTLAYGGIFNSTLTSFDLASADFYELWVYLPTITGFTTVWCRLGSDGSNHITWRWRLSGGYPFVVGWNHLRFENNAGLYDGTLISRTVVGSPVTTALDYCGLGLEFAAAANTYSGIIFDWLTKHTRTLGTECYNTASTCDDLTRYAENVSTKTYRLCEVNAPIPPGVGAFPVITSIGLAAGEVSPGKGLGGRDRITIDGIDPEHGDEAIDPYLHKRRTGQTGGLMEKLVARNLYYPGRELYIRTGYVDHEGTLYVDGMTSQRYRIEDISINGGKFRIQALDLLAATEKAQTPIPTSGELLATMAVGATSFDLSTTGDGTQYDTYGVPPYYVRIDDEIMLVGARSSEAFSSVTRAQWGTTAAEHAANARVQLCRDWEDAYVDAIWADLLEDDLGITASLIDSATAATERATWIPYLTDLIISKPMDTEQVISDLSRHWNFLTWWDALAQLVKFSAISPREPGETGVEITDEDIIQGSLSHRVMTASRITRQPYLFGISDWSRDFASQSKDEPAYTRVVLAIDSDAEDVTQYGDKRGTPIFAYSVPAGQTGLAKTMAYRLVSRFRDPPKQITFKLDESKGAQLSVGSEIDLSTSRIRGVDGLPVEDLQCRVTKLVPPRGLDGAWEVTVETTGFGGVRWWFWAPSGTADYGDNEADDLYAHWAEDDGLMPNGDPGYLKI